MANSSVASKKNCVQSQLERAHSPDTAAQIFIDKIQYRQLYLRPTSQVDDGLTSAAVATCTPPTIGVTAPTDAATIAAFGATGHNGREVRRRSRRVKQEQRQAHQPKPKPLSARQRRHLGLHCVPGIRSTSGSAHRYATFLPLYYLWLGYMREVLSPQELRCGGPGAAAKLTAADFHGAMVEVTRSACIGRVGIRGIVVRDTRFVFEVITPDNRCKMVPKEGTFFRIEIPVQHTTNDEGGRMERQEQECENNYRRCDDSQRSGLVFEIAGSQFLHRAADRANRKFKQHFHREL